MPQSLVQIVYDGECPFCSSYVRLQRLKSTYAVELINARESHPILAEIRELGLDLDEGMVVKIEDGFSCGADALHRLAVMSLSVGYFQRMANWTLSSPVRARILYPALRAGRNLVLRILGRKKINDPGL